MGHFLKAQGQLIFCEVLEQVDPQNARIRLMDGRQFITQASKISLRTRNERAVMIQITEHYDKIAAIYKLLSPEIQIDGHEHLLQLEFEAWPSPAAFSLAGT